MPDNTLSTLEQIRIKVRRLTRSPSTAQLSDSDIDNYVNTFVLYDFPEHLRMTYLRTTLTFYTQPDVAEYWTDTTLPDDPLYNFDNQYITTHAPAYIAGNPVAFSQSREQFYAMFPMPSIIAPIPTKGNGVLTNFTGTLSQVPVLMGSVTFTSIDANDNGLVLIDDWEGNLVIPNSTATVPASWIDYVTGDYELNFTTPPAIGVDIKSQVYPYVASRPQAICFFENSFILRPVPDQVYPVNLEVYRRPSELLLSTSMPELSEWWQYIAYGAAKKVLEDRMDPDTVQIIMPEFKKQEELILNRVAVQQSDQQVATIYNTGFAVGPFGFYNNGLGY